MMKRLFTLCLALTAMTLGAMAQSSSVIINETNFPDAVFRNYVKKFDTNPNNLLTQAEMAAVKEINVRNKGISDLTGIAYFTNLEKLDCSYNSLTSLNVTKNTKLTILACAINQLKTLTLSSNSELKELSCGSNQLTELNVSACKQLERLYCAKNKLTKLNFRDCEELKLVSCQGNMIQGKGMQELVSSLPKHKGLESELYICDYNLSPDNIITPDHVNSAKLKGWEVLKETASGDYVSYGGCEGIKIEKYRFSGGGYLIAKIADTIEDDYLIESEIEALTEVTLEGEEFNTLKGFKAFTSLKKLIIKNCNVSTLDKLSEKADLTWLEINGCKLTYLDTNSLPMLKYLSVKNNNLESLDLSNMPDLEELYCNGNNLSNLDCSNKTKLTKLDCYNNKLTSLNIWNTKLTSLNCYNNDLSYLDIFGCNNLQTISCYGNHIKGAVMNNLVDRLPKVSNGEIYIMDKTDNNVITTRQVQIATGKGWKVYARPTKAWTIYEGRNINIAIDNTNFPDQTFRNYVLAQTYGKDGVLDEDDIMSVTEMDLKGKSIGDLMGIEYFWYITSLDCSNNNLASLELSENTALGYLICNNNKLTELNLPKLETLATVECYNNELTQLDVTSNTTLQSLLCYGNKLEKLDVTKNTELTILVCDKNQLNALDLSSNSKLKELSCAFNQLTELNVSACKQLESLDCSNNSLSMLNLLLNSVLASLRCQDNQLTTLYLSNPELAYLYCYNNKLTSLDVSFSERLNTLHCYGNNIHGEAMDKMVNGMPKKNGALACVFRVCSTEYEQDNSITSGQVKIATGKKWTVQKWNGTKWVDYAGLGDVNGDNKIDQTDLDTIVKIIMGQVSLGYAGDLNNDGKTDAADVVEMVNILKSLGK